MHATSDSNFRPSALPFTANFRRSSSVSRSRRPLSCDLSTSFSAWRYSIAACCLRFTQPAKITIKKCTGNGILIHTCCSPTPPRLSSTPVRVFGHYAPKSLEIGISSAILRLRMAFIPRIFTPSRDHFFLLGPRGTGKTLWSTHHYPKALRIRADFLGRLII